MTEGTEKIHHRDTETQRGQRSADTGLRPDEGGDAIRGDKQQRLQALLISAGRVTSQRASAHRRNAPRSLSSLRDLCVTVSLW